jgi:hypothetical protein
MNEKMSKAASLSFVESTGWVVSGVRAPNAGPFFVSANSLLSREDGLAACLQANYQDSPAKLAFFDRR